MRYIFCWPKEFRKVCSWLYPYIWNDKLPTNLSQQSVKDAKYPLEMQAAYHYDAVKKEGCIKNWNSKSSSNSILLGEINSLDLYKFSWQEWSKSRFTHIFYKTTYKNVRLLRVKI